MTAATGPDLRRTHPAVWRAPDDPELVVVPPVRYLMVDGAGDPSTAPAYVDAVHTLYAVSYGVRALVKASGGAPWTVMPLEGLWWADDLTTFTSGRRDGWLWTMLIAQHDGVTAELVAEALDAATRKGKAPAAERLRLEVLDEGEVVQVMHHGPYATEGPTIERLHAFAADAGRGLRGHHHEVYLSDPRRVAPERMRTILRQPVGP
ncbi:GyrI-like domain-containing protein [Cellulomonas sp. NPDC055163]